MIIDAVRNGNFVMLVYALPILILTLMIHEVCHGLAAYALGDTTAKEQGRLTFNPLKHIDPVGFLMMMAFGFGWAKPVSVDISRMKNPKTGFALTAAAGPLSNLAAAFIFSLLYAFTAMPYLQADGTMPVGTVMFYVILALQYGLFINVGLALFNLIPIPPLDGSRILGVLLPERAYIRYLQLGRYGMFLVLGISALGGFSSFLPDLIQKAALFFLGISIDIANLVYRLIL